MCTQTCAATAGFPLAEILSSSEQGPAPPSITGVIDEADDEEVVESFVWPTATMHANPSTRNDMTAMDRDCVIRNPRTLCFKSFDTISEDFLSKRRKRKLNGEIGSLVMFVDYGIHLDDLQA